MPPSGRWLPRGQVDAGLVARSAVATRIYTRWQRVVRNGRERSDSEFHCATPTGLCNLRKRQVLQCLPAFSKAL